MKKKEDIIDLVPNADGVYTPVKIQKSKTHKPVVGRQIIHAPRPTPQMAHPIDQFFDGVEIGAELIHRFIKITRIRRF